MKYESRVAKCMHWIENESLFVGCVTKFHYPNNQEPHISVKALVYTVVQFLAIMESLVVVVMISQTIDFSMYFFCT